MLTSFLQCEVQGVGGGWELDCYLLAWCNVQDWDILENMFNLENTEAGLAYKCYHDTPQITNKIAYTQLTYTILSYYTSSHQ